MPQYHFHLQDRFGYTPDEDGRGLPDLETARQEALEGIRSIMSDEVKRGRMDLRGQVDIADQDGAVLLSVAFKDAVIVDTEQGQ